MDSIKVLVVDDESRMRKLVKDFLSKKGYIVLEAGDGEEAVDIFMNNKDIGLIILDVMMPKMDGWETCKEIRKFSQVPIIMLTAKSDERDELLGFELGIDEYITKPFSPKILVARVEAILRRTSDVPADSVTFRSKNVVVLVLESFGKEYFGSLNKELEDGNYKGYTPFLDSLVSESLVYKYSFANGQQSIDGLPSILSGIPRFVEPFFLTPASLNKLSSVGGELKKKGYYTAFFHGARDGSMGFQAYARAVGYPDYFGREEYGNDDDFDGNWAIWDEEFLQFFADKMSSFPQPFSAGIFTASSHHPYVIPDRYKGVFPDGTLEIHKCIRYSDNALRLFFEKASKESWFENTLFVLTADHTNQTEHPEYWTDYGRYAVPIIFYTPDGDLKGYRDAIAQQIDIMPTVLSYLGYDKPYVSFGCDLLNTPAEDTYAVNYNNGIYQYFKGDYILQFDGEKTVAVYAFKTDKLLKENLVGQVPQQGAMELELKAIIQQYMERMNGDRMTVE